MRIDPPNQRNNIRDIGSAKRKPAAGSSSSDDGPNVEDQIALAQIHNMVDQLISQPEIRESMVELGRKLVNDPSYPPSEVVDRVAEILSRAIRRRSE